MGASLVFDCEVEDQDKGAAEVKTHAKTAAYWQALHARLAYFWTPQGNVFCSKLLRDVKHFVKAVMVEQGEQQPDTVLLATELSAVGYIVTVRAALGGGASCFRNLRHDFLAVRGTGDYEGAEFIVEPRFREQFLISHPTAEYSELLLNVPDVFVGTSARLVPVVQVLCSEMADSFDQMGLTLPPWRRTQSMLSKWMPVRAKDTSFSRTSLPEHSDPFSAGQAGFDAMAPAFSRVSDPVFDLQSAPPRAEEGAHINMAWQQVDPATLFVPFGGRATGPARTVGTSPPAAAAAYGAPGQALLPLQRLHHQHAAVAAAAAGRGTQQQQQQQAPALPHGQPALASQAAQRQAAPHGQPGAATPPHGSHHGGHVRGLLSARLLSFNSETAAAAAAFAAAAAGQLQQPHQAGPHHAVDGPVYEGQPPIHKVKRGFVVQPQQQQPQEQGQAPQLLQ